MGALLIGNRAQGKRSVKEKVPGGAVPFSQVHCKAQAGKGAVAGIGKGQGEILMAVSRTVIALNPVFPVLVHTAAVKLVIFIIRGMFPHIFQRSHYLKSGAGGIKTLGGPV